MSWDELSLWLESPSRRALLLAYAGIFFTFVWLLWNIVYLFIYQRILFTLIGRDLEWAWQLTHFIGRGRNLGYAYFRSPARSEIKFILFGETILHLKLRKPKSDPRRFRARLLLIAREGSAASIPGALFVRRVRDKVVMDKLFVRLALGLGDPALTAMAAGVFYPVTAALSAEEQRFVSILPLFDRDGIDAEVEIGAGFRLYRVLIPWLRYVLNPRVIAFAWRWRFPKLPKQAKENEHAGQVLWNRVVA
ncbi:MAG: hypothetical protein AB1405_12635 [Bdellovibrionota bacterium]